MSTWSTWSSCRGVPAEAALLSYSVGSVNGESAELCCSNCESAEGTGEASSRGVDSSTYCCIMESVSAAAAATTDVDELRDMGGEDEGLDEDSMATERIDDMAAAAAADEEEDDEEAEDTGSVTTHRWRLTAGAPRTDEGSDTGSRVTSPASNRAETSAATSAHDSGWAAVAEVSPSSDAGDWLTNTDT
jgi:hypothetical protein